MYTKFRREGKKRGREMIERQEERKRKLILYNRCDDLRLTGFCISLPGSALLVWLIWYLE